ncbi:LOW QUALITY PROTEIN: uncharacterized protein O8D03_013904 [Erethizon dorsatum]
MTVRNVPKVNLTELWAAAQQSRKNQAKYGIGEPGNRTLIDNCISDSKNKDMVETLTKTSVNVWDFSPSSFSSPAPEPKEKATGPAIRKEKGSQEQTNDNVTNVDGGQKNYKSDMMLALGLEEDDEPPWDSESISENLPQKSVDHLFGAADERGKPAGNRQVGDVVYVPSCVSGSRNFKMAKLEDTGDVGIPVAHKESPEKHLHWKPAIEMEDSVPSEAVAMKDVQTFKSESPEKYLHWKPAIETEDSVPSEAVGMKDVQTFKSEKEKRKNIYQFYETLKEQLRKKEEQYYQEVEARRLEISVRTLDMELKTVRSKLSQLEEAQDKIQEYLQKLELENSRLKVKIKKQAGKIEHLQKNLVSANLVSQSLFNFYHSKKELFLYYTNFRKHDENNDESTSKFELCSEKQLFSKSVLIGISFSEDDKEQLKKLTEIAQSLYTLDQVKKKNNELEKELIGLKKHFKMMETKFNEQENGEFCFHGDLKSIEFETDNPINTLIHKIDDLAAKLETTSSKCRHVDQNNQFLHQELLMKTMQKKCETLEEDKKKLEQEVVNLKSHVENIAVEQYKQEIEERARQELLEKLKQVNLFLQTQAASQEHLEQLRECNNASVRSQMELRIKDLKSELSKMKTQQDDKKTQLEGR